MALQVAEDPQLLELMLADTERAPDLYKPTNFWSAYARFSVPELRARGLRDFRRREESVLAQFGAAELPPARADFFQNRWFYNRYSSRIPGWRRLLASLNGLRHDFLPDAVEKEWVLAARETARRYGEEAGARPLSALEPSLAGNPRYVYDVGGKLCSMNTLSYYMRYASCRRRLDFDRIKTVVEIGPGGGGQVEVIKKLHPDACFFLFDIPPQLYVCEQYLRTVFPGDVVGYRETREMNALAPRKGKIFILGNWKFPVVESLDIDLFWNAVSFQEMEPDVVANYLAFVNRRAAAVFLQERMAGKDVAPSAGAVGVLRRTTIEDYRKGLPDFELSDLQPSQGPHGTVPGQSDSFWRSRNR